MSKLTIDLFLVAVYFIVTTGGTEIIGKYAATPTVLLIWLAVIYVMTGLLVAFVAESKRFWRSTFLWLPIAILNVRNMRGIPKKP